jgi:hypothetical protein
MASARDQIPGESIPSSFVTKIFICAPPLSLSGFCYLNIRKKSAELLVNNFGGNFTLEKTLSFKYITLNHGLSGLNTLVQKQFFFGQHLGDHHLSKGSHNTFPL